MEAPDHENTTANEERAEIESATEVQRLKEELRREHDTLLPP